MPLPLTVSCFSKIQTGFTFLVTAHLGSPRKRAVKRVCVCVCVVDTLCTLPDAYSPKYVEAAWYSWWEKQRFFSPGSTEGYLVSKLLVCGV